MPSYLQKIIRNKSSFKIYFIGNEYKHMPEKVSFIKYLKINLLITQSHSREVINHYKDNLKINVDHIVNTGLDDEIFFPKINYEKEKNYWI